MRNENTSLITLILVFLMISIPIIDCLTGYFVLEGKDTYVNLIFRSITIIFLLFVVLKKNSNRKIFFLFLLLMFLISDLVMVYFKNYSVVEIKENAFMITKLLMPILFILGISNALNNKHITYEIINKIFRFYMFFIPLSLIIPYLMGVGMNIYNNGILKGVGYKGFYNAGNDLNVVLIIISIFVIAEFLNNKSVKNFVYIIMIIVSLILLGTKTSLVTFFLALFICIFRKENKKKVVKNIIIIVLLLSFIAIVINLFFDNIINDYIRTYLKVYKENNDVFSFLFSGRNNRIGPIFKYYYTENSSVLFNVVFGVGYYMQVKVGSLNSLIEMDYLDTLVWFGWIIANVFLLFYLSVYLKARKKSVKIEYKLAYLIVLIYSLLGGHVWYSAFSGSIFGILGGVLLSAKNETGENNENDCGLSK